MPLYEYACRACGHRFEILQCLGEGAEGLACPGCGAADLAKQFSTFATGAADRSPSAAPAGCGAGCACAAARAH